MSQRYTRAVVCALLLASFALAKESRAQTHFSDCLTRTGNNAHLLIPADTEALVGESPVVAGDELAAFTPDGLCAGAVVWKDGSMALTIWGDDSFTNTVESYRDGDSLRFAFWDASAGIEYGTVDVELQADLPYYRSEPTYAKDGIYLLSNLAVPVEMESPLVSSPRAGGRGVDTRPTLSWSAVSGANSYEVDIAVDSSYQEIAVALKDLTTTSVTPQALNEGTTYYWRVRGVTASGNSTYATASFTTRARQSIQLVSGWNLISSRIKPSADVDEVFGSMTSDVLLVKNGLGQLYSPEFGINTIGAWQPHHAYHVYTTSARTLELAGDFVTEGSALPLEKGWNLFAYWPTTSAEVEAALASIAEKVIIVKNGAGQVWLPEFDVNSMTPMAPGAGYLVYVSAAAELVYPEPAGKNASGDGKGVAGSTQVRTMEASVGANATLLLFVEGAEDGAVIQAVDETGAIVGRGEVESEKALLVLLGDDELTPDVREGARPGEALTLQLHGESARDLVSEGFRDVLTDASSDQLVYKNDGVWVADVSLAASAAEVPEEFLLMQNYPNPFNPSTTITYALPEAAAVRLEVWNMLGQRVRVLVDEQQAASTYSVDFEAGDLPSGVYFYTLRAGDQTAVKQMLLLK